MHRKGLFSDPTFAIHQNEYGRTLLWRYRCSRGSNAMLRTRAQYTHDTLDPFSDYIILKEARPVRHIMIHDEFIMHAACGRWPLESLRSDLCQFTNFRIRFMSTEHVVKIAAEWFTSKWIKVQFDKGKGRTQSTFHKQCIWCCAAKR